MKFSHAKFQAVLMCAGVALAVPMCATSATAASPAGRDTAFTQIALQQPVDLLAVRRSGMPMNPSLSPPHVTCDAALPAKICDVRNAAARRAWEVVMEENAAAGASVPEASVPAPEIPLSLLVPAGFIIPVRAIACDPALSAEECAKLDRRVPSNPPGPLPPNARPPAAPAPPPSANPPPPVTVPEAKTPPSAVDPVPVTPPSVIPPPPTGDDDLVKKPPKTNSQMPVIKPKAAPPVNPEPNTEPKQP